MALDIVAYCLAGREDGEGDKKTVDVDVDVVSLIEILGVWVFGCC